jgi:hypothetical protein
LHHAQPLLSVLLFGKKQNKRLDSNPPAHRIKNCVIAFSQEFSFFIFTVFPLILTCTKWS